MTKLSAFPAFDKHGLLLPKDPAKTAATPILAENRIV